MHLLCVDCKSIVATSITANMDEFLSNSTSENMLVASKSYHICSLNLLGHWLVSFYQVNLLQKMMTLIKKSFIFFNKMLLWILHFHLWAVSYLTVKFIFKGIYYMHVCYLIVIIFWYTDYEFICLYHIYKVLLPYMTVNVDLLLNDCCVISLIIVLQPINLTEYTPKCYYLEPQTMYIIPFLNGIDIFVFKGVVRRRYRDYCVIRDGSWVYHKSSLKFCCSCWS